MKIYSKKYKHSINTSLTKDEIIERISKASLMHSGREIKVYNSKFKENSFEIKPIFYRSPNFLIYPVINGVIKEGKTNTIDLEISLDKTWVATLKGIIYINIPFLLASPFIAKIVLEDIGVSEYNNLIIIVTPIVYFLLLAISPRITYFFLEVRIEENIKILKKLFK